jgi:hypothetical protein
MKLAELFEAATKETVVTKAEKQEANKKRAERSSDLGSYANAVRDAKDIEAKKTALRNMASHFTAGGKEKFLKSVDGIKTPADADKLAYNTLLKGEGKGSLKNH